MILLSLEFLSERRSKIAKTIQTFDALKPEKLFEMLPGNKNSDTQTKFFSIWAAGFATKDVKS
jgi:hypothetical protein